MAAIRKRETSQPYIISSLRGRRANVIDPASKDKPKLMLRAEKRYQNLGLKNSRQLASRARHSFNFILGIGPLWADAQDYIDQSTDKTA